MLLTVACPAGIVSHLNFLIFKPYRSPGPQNYEKLHLQEMDHYLDFWNVMAYDYAGTFSNVAGHQANLYPSTSNPDSTPFSTSAAIEYYKSRGIAGTKLVLGMPIYGRAFASTNGPGQPFSGGGEGSWEQGIWDYKVLPQDGATEMYDEEAGASWSYDSGKQLMVSYDSKEMVGHKVNYIKNEKLGGAMWWESSADKKGDESLIGIVSCFVIGRFEYGTETQHRSIVRLLVWIKAITPYHIQNRSTIIYETECQMSSGLRDILNSFISNQNVLSLVL